MARLAAQRQHTSSRRASETPNQLSQSLTRSRTRKAARRAALTEKEREAELQQRQVLHSIGPARALPRPQITSHEEFKTAGADSL